MQKTIKEEDFIEMIGYDSYINFVKTTYENIKNCEAYERNDDVIYTIGAMPLDNGEWFHYEASLFKTISGDDFGFTKMIITNDLDFTFDSINDAKHEIKSNGGQDGIWFNN